MRPGTHSLRVLLLAVAVLLVLATGCGRSPSLADLQAAYAVAVADAMTAEPEEISVNLVAIVPHNSDLVWEGEPGNSRVLVVTWTSWDGYNGKAGQSMLLAREVWVTVAPDIQAFFRGKCLSGDRLTLRLEQLLGLPPQSGKQWFVEVWADPDSLFRPSPDPGISDHEAELDFPDYVSSDYMAWFNGLKDSSYGENGYPWTRLGYTYDWSNPKSEVGLSEFVVKAGSTVEVSSVYSTSDYVSS